MPAVAQERSTAMRRSAVSPDQDRRAGLLSRLPTTFISFPTTSGRVIQGGVITRPDGDRFVAVSLHLDAFDSGRRSLQAEEVLAGVRRLNMDSAFLCGDFNLDPSIHARGSEDQSLYRLLTKEYQDAAKFAGPTTMVSRRLDYVFFRSPHPLQVASRVLRDKRVGLMDHDPLLVEVVY